MVEQAKTKRKKTGYRTAWYRLLIADRHVVRPLLVQYSAARGLGERGSEKARTVTVVSGSQWMGGLAERPASYAAQKSKCKHYQDGGNQHSLADPAEQLVMPRPLNG